MFLKLNKLALNNFDPSDKRNIKLYKDLENDQLINIFVSNKIGEQLKESSNCKRLSIGNTYVVSDDRKLVGFIRLNDYNDNEMELHYGVNPNYRKLGYGSKILLEVSDYLFKHTDVTNVKLVIRKVNNASIKCATNAGFNIDPNETNNDIVVYKKKRK